MMDPLFGGASKHSAHDGWNWFEKKRQERTQSSELAVKAAQIDLLQIVAQRLCKELQENCAGAPASELLLWLLHGGPGIGKAEVLLMVRTF